MGGESDNSKKSNYTTTTTNVNQQGTAGPAVAGNNNRVTSVAPEVVDRAMKAVENSSDNATQISVDALKHYRFIGRDALLTNERVSENAMEIVANSRRDALLTNERVSENAMEIVANSVRGDGTDSAERVIQNALPAVATVIVAWLLSRAR